MTLGETQALLTGSESCLGVDLPQVFIVISCIGVSGVNSDVHSNDMLVYVFCLFVCLTADVVCSITLWMKNLVFIYVKGTSRHKRCFAQGGSCFSYQ